MHTIASIVYNQYLICLRGSQTVGRDDFVEYVDSEKYTCPKHFCYDENSL